MPFTGFASMDHVASWSESGGIDGNPARGRFASHAGSGLTTTFDGAICDL